MYVQSMVTPLKRFGYCLNKSTMLAASEVLVEAVRTASEKFELHNHPPTPRVNLNDEFVCFKSLLNWPNNPRSEAGDDEVFCGSTPLPMNGLRKSAQLNII